MTNPPAMAIQIKARDVMAGTTLRVDIRDARRQRLRSRLGAAVLAIGARIIGVQIDVSFSARRQHVRCSTVEAGLPRRYDTASPDYGRYGDIYVRLDGELQHDATGYDVDKGTVTRSRRDASGKIMLAGDHILSETIEGCLTVNRFPD